MLEREAGAWVLVFGSLCCIFLPQDCLTGPEDIAAWGMMLDFPIGQDRIDEPEQDRVPVMSGHPLFVF